MEDNNMKEKKPSKRLIMAIAAVLVVLLAIFIGINMYNAPKRQLAEQLDLGNRYLEEMDYEQAVLAFTKAIEIDPMSVDAHLGLVEAYIRQGDFDLALEAAEKGYEMTGDERLKEKADMIESGEIFDSLGRVMKRTGYDESGNVAWWHIFTYNLKGQQASIAAYDSTGEEMGKIEMVYDEEGNETIGCIISPIDGHIRLSKHIYQEGRMVRYEEYADIAGDTLSYYHTYEYDENGIQKRIEHYDADGTLQGYSIPEFDNNGQMIKQSDYIDNGDGSIRKSEHIREYDGNGNCIRYEHYNEGKMDMYRICEYAEDGTCISTRAYDGDGNLQYEE